MVAFHVEEMKSGEFAKKQVLKIEEKLDEKEKNKDKAKSDEFDRKSYRIKQATYKELTGIDPDAKATLSKKKDTNADQVKLKKYIAKCFVG